MFGPGGVVRTAGREESGLFANIGAAALVSAYSERTNVGADVLKGVEEVIRVFK